MRLSPVAAACSASLVCSVLLSAAAPAGAAKAPPAAQTSGAAAVVVKFYNWYLLQHGHPESHFAQVKTLFDPELYDELSGSYFKSEGEKYQFYVNTTPGQSIDKMSNFDPYVGAAAPATSFAVGFPAVGHLSVPRSGAETQIREVTFVPVTFAFGGTHAKRSITLLLLRNGGAFQIYDIRYGRIPFYYAGQISDLQTFLSAYNC